MKNTWIFTNLTAIALLVLGCDPKDGTQGEAIGTEGEEPQTTGEPTNETDPPDTPDTPDDDSPDPNPLDETSGGEEPMPEDTEGECSFFECQDPTDTIFDCDLWAQDCEDGEKCTPWANDGGVSWNAARCTTVDASPGQPGDPCMVEGNGATGFDSCDVGSMCWDVDEENSGTCVALCQGSPDAPLCDDPEDQCIIANDGALPLCLPQCDPLLGCPDGQGCYPGDGGFICVPDASGPDQGGYGDACAYANVCDPGLFCANPAVVPGCDAEGCCTNYCDLSEAEPSATCGGVAGGQECVPAFEDGMVPPGLEDVGVCAIPD